MYEIDLLKGQGLPIKSRPGGIAIVMVGFVVPMIIAIAMMWSYVNSKVGELMIRQEAAILDSEINSEELSIAVKKRTAFLTEEGKINSCLSEAKSAVISQRSERERRPARSPLPEPGPRSPEIRSLSGTEWS